jgi:FtsZ-binding cell division protein ZapB
MASLFQGLKEDNERLATEIRKLSNQNATLKTNNENLKLKLQENQVVIQGL